jgi:hypothetical protein
MNDDLQAGSAIGALGYALTLANLPPAETTRWTPFRKADVAAAVNAGLLTSDQACDRYQLTLEELSAWRWALAQGGLPALRATKAQTAKRREQVLAASQEAAWIR